MREHPYFNLLLSFDISSFDMSDDTSSRLNLEALEVESITIYP